MTMWAFDREEVSNVAISITDDDPLRYGRSILSLQDNIHDVVERLLARC
jgi:hypothetical protein